MQVLFNLEQFSDETRYNVTCHAMCERFKITDHEFITKWLRFFVVSTWSLEALRPELTTKAILLFENLAQISKKLKIFRSFKNLDVIEKFFNESKNFNIA